MIANYLIFIYYFINLIASQISRHHTYNIYKYLQFVFFIMNISSHLLKNKYLIIESSIIRNN
jgi:hypothetical protein